MTLTFELGIHAHDGDTEGPNEVSVKCLHQLQRVSLDICVPFIYYIYSI